MRRQVAWMIAIVFGVLLVQGAAAGPKERTGARLNVLTGTSVFPAGEPFYIQHGWGINSTNSATNPVRPKPPGRFSFSLAVDGQERQEDFIDRFHQQDATSNVRQWIFNFPAGMTGTHTFTGRWLGPCEALANQGLAELPCDNPVEIREAPVTITVVFVP